MLTEFEDFCTWMYVTIDDIWQKIGGLFNHPGSKPQCSDSGLITLAIVGECLGWDKETEMLSYWQAYHQLFPVLPERSRFNRRRRRLVWAVGYQFGAASSFHRAWFAGGDWAGSSATYGRVASKHQTFYGYKLQMLVTLSGVILDFELAPANESDLAVGLELLENQHNLEVLGDKAYLNQLQQAEIARANQKTLPRLNQKKRSAPACGTYLTVYVEL